MLGDVEFEAEVLPPFDGTRQLVLRGVLDAGTVGQLEQAARTIFGNDDVTVVVVNLELLTFSDPACLMAIKRLSDRSALRHVHFRLVKPQPQVLEALKQAGLVDLLEG